jgi:hypothetical protein
MADVEPAAPRGEPYEPSVREPWTPGAGWARLQREHPELIPEVTEEDLRRADEILAATDRQDELRRRRGAGPS